MRLGHAVLVTNNARPLRFSNNRPIRANSSALVFGAEDEAGWLEVWVPADVWEALQAEAPLPYDADDRRDYALGMIEMRAARQAPRATAAGVRTVMVA